MVAGILTTLSLLGGLFFINEVSIRHVSLLGLFVMMAFLVLLELPKIKIPPIQYLVALGFLLAGPIAAFILINPINPERFLSYNLLSIAGFLGFLFLFLLKDSRRFDYNLTFLLVTLGIAFGSLNIFFLITEPRPFEAISALSGTPLVNFSKLYNRIIMPFGHPAQLGFVAGCCLIVVMTGPQRLFQKTTIFGLLLIIFFTGANSVFLAGLMVSIIFYSRRLFTRSSGLLTILALPLIITVVGVGAGLVGYTYRSLDNIGLSALRHLMLRTQTLDEILSFSVFQLFFGVGAGQSLYHIDGSYSFTVLLTQFLEGGLSLVLLQISVFGLLYKICSTRDAKAILTFTIIVSLFYQTNNDISFYLFPLICNILISRRRPEVKHSEIARAY